MSTLLLSYVVPVKSKVEIWQNFVAFSEYMNFTSEPKVELNISDEQDFDVEEETFESNLPQAPKTDPETASKTAPKITYFNTNTVEVNKRKVLLLQDPQTAPKTVFQTAPKTAFQTATKTANQTAPKTACFDTQTVEVNNRKILIMTCSDCGEKFSSKPKLFDHCLTVHKKNVLFSCENCGFTPLNTMGNLLKGIVNKIVRT